MKNLAWIKFSKANGARWLMAVPRHDSIVGKKSVGNSIFGEKSVGNLLGGRRRKWLVHTKLLASDNFIEDMKIN